MPAPRHPLIAGAVITSVGTLASRVLGMVRDMATAALFGLSGKGVADAFVIAYSIPNLFRRLFGEGALTASYLPVVAGQLEKDPKRAWQLASVLFTWLSLLLSGLVVLGEAVLLAIRWAWGDVPGVPLLVGLSAVMLPYLMLICLAAQLTATLHALGHFSVPALTPIVLNVVWLAAAWLVAPLFAPDQESQAYVLAAAIVVAGAMQVLVQVPTLRRLGFRFDYNAAASRDAMRQIGRTMAPMLIGLAVTQINTFNDRMMAWLLARAPDGPERIAWLGNAVEYPLEQGAATAIYFSERLYEFPVGIMGLAVATAIFPLLSRHAARGDTRQLGEDLTLGLRLVLCLGVPAGVGLIVLSEPLTRLIYEHGQFTPADTARAARMLVYYAAGVWAYCASHVLVRGFYALGDAVTPVKVAAWIVGLNLTLNLLLIWPLAEAGFAAATAIAAVVQVVVLAWVFSRRKAKLGWPALAATAARTLAATALMAGAGYGVLAALPPAGNLWGELTHVLAPLAICTLVFCTAYWLCGGRELAMFFRTAPRPDQWDSE